jgi:hypothetical protein
VTTAFAAGLSLNFTAISEIITFSDLTLANLPLHFREIRVKMEETSVIIIC